MAMGRPQRPYHTSWGELIPGLCHQPDGRWRIIATGKRFTEADEQIAIAKFRRWQNENGTPKADLPLPYTHPDKFVADLELDTILPKDLDITLAPDGKINVSMPTFEAAVLAWVRKQLLERPAWMADRLAIPQLASILDMPIRQGIKLEEIQRNYLTNSPAGKSGKAQALGALERLIKFAKAETLDDLSTSVLLAFKTDIENDKTIKSAGTRKAYYGRIKSIVSFGKKTGMNTPTIDATLSRMAVLWTAQPVPAPSPQPIKREDFHKLLKAASPQWQAFLLIGLNLCMSMDEVCDLKWKDFDLEKRTYAALRGKTKRKRVPRAAVLWRETLDALKGIKRTAGPFVFTSSHGTRYNRNTKVNDFRELADKLGLSLTFNSIRDGAYTAACQNSTDERAARVLAGHKARGLQDSYVLRNPQYAQPACDAVYQQYFG